MERMAGVDAGYLYMETPTMHMHTLKVAVVEPPETFDLERLTEQVLGRLHRLPPFERRLLTVPLGLNHPLWVADQPIDPARHLFHHDLPDSGGMVALERFVGEIASTPLDRSLPLWELHVCRPFEDGSIAVVAKIHHALADGAAANALLANLMDDSEPLLGDPVDLEPLPSRRRQSLLALRDGARRALSLPGLLVGTVRGVLRVLTGRRRSSTTVPKPVLDTPRASFNGALTPRRSFATHALPLDLVKAVAKAHGVTVNDVVLGVVGGALRRWMTGQGERVGSSLMAGVPVATDAPGSGPRLGGNRVSNLFTTLATDVPDAHERLARISQVTSEAKRVQRTLGPDMLTDWVEFTPPGPMSLAMRVYSRLRLADRHPPPFNVVVSNVRGPAEPIYIAGAKLTDLFSVGPILEGIGLNVTAWSYGDRLNVSLLTCPDLLPDLAPLVAELSPALDELDIVPDSQSSRHVPRKVADV